ncbi:MAG: amino-acid acetyltransferase [Porticoccaceae bacterium]|nr:MAG: amino-acid acetyltransferase [Porticoccaceae bacterium]
MEAYVKFFRNTCPYINAHRGATFVVGLSGEAVEDPAILHLVQDLALLHSLGIRLVLVHGARPQIDRALAQAGIAAPFHGGRRLCDAAAMACVREAVGGVRLWLESQLSMGLANSPMHGAALRVTGGNFVAARPLGVRDGVDFHYAGEVRKVDAAGIRRLLEGGFVVLLSSVGHSLTGETFNLSYPEVAQEVAVALGAAKLIFYVDGPGVVDEAGALLRSLSVAEARTLAGERADPVLAAAAEACARGVARSHLIGYRRDGALLEELFTHDGAGTLVVDGPREQIRRATGDDLPALLEILVPLEEEGVLVRRPRERLEREIDHFYLVEDAERMVVACMALYPLGDGESGELACVATHPDHRNRGYASRLLAHLEQEARRQGVRRLFVLTTRASHWFVEHGFAPSRRDELPAPRRELYNLQRNSRVLVKAL